MTERRESEERLRCPECGGTRIEVQTMGGLWSKTGLDTTNRATCACGFRAQAAVFQVAGRFVGADRQATLNRLGALRETFRLVFGREPLRSSFTAATLADLYDDLADTIDDPLWKQDRWWKEPKPASVTIPDGGTTVTGITVIDIARNTQRSFDAPEPEPCLGCKTGKLEPKSASFVDGELRFTVRCACGAEQYRTDLL